MARTDKLFKNAFNTCLDHLSESEGVSSIAGLARRLGTSRTTSRRVIARLVETGLVEEGSGARLRPPRADDYFSVREVQSTESLIETAFMQWVLRDDVRPQTRFREAELARRFDVSPGAIREFLIRFSRFRLIRKEPRRYWVFEGFTRELAIELCDVREMFEFHALEHLLAMPGGDGRRQRFVRLRQEHTELLERMDTEYLRFSDIDVRFHRAIIGAADNRFITGFDDLISIIFHYHYRWDRGRERDRNIVAVQEHIDFLDGFLAGDTARARSALRIHLATARQTLLDAVRW